ncbi:MAG: hypothetical protein HRU09_09105 [Oligoflexales bacterium]|nr:hypothetical protein [Oligoflexales bacterium]
MTFILFLVENPLLIVTGIILATVVAFSVDSYYIKKNQSDYSEEFRIFCLFLQTNPDRFSRKTMIEMLDKAKIYNFKYGHLPRSKRPELMKLLNEHEG